MGTRQSGRGRHVTSNKIDSEMGTFLSLSLCASLDIFVHTYIQGLGSLWRVVVDRCNSTVKQREQWIKLGRKAGLSKDQIACVRSYSLYVHDNNNYK